MTKSDIGGSREALYYAHIFFTHTDIDNYRIIIHVSNIYKQDNDNEIAHHDSIRGIKRLIRFSVSVWKIFA